LAYALDNNSGTGFSLVRYRSTDMGQETESTRQQFVDVNREFDLSWIRSYESDDGKAIISIYDAADGQTLKQHAICLGLQIIEVIHVAEVLPPKRPGRRSGVQSNEDSGE
jgi:hypothetical protein